MAHYAFVKDSLVTEVITGVDENTAVPDGFTSWEAFYLSLRPDQDSCLRTSYNTNSNSHILGGSPFRGNFAGINYIYDETNDVFYSQQPYPSWTLDNNWVWQPPIAMPDDGNEYTWNENTQTWE